jgi:hypothetical protein
LKSLPGKNTPAYYEKLQITNKKVLWHWDLELEFDKNIKGPLPDHQIQVF